ncbi:hypothetical protein [Tichowtungia aerotolerans]|uniref:Uncharacterized protein n=1 Tax=Tichowtungia aerotolerans TaxID=2697043 RepID=A0A6P1M4E2_9BACT|nr:hypothetical protein [Tichowtungia aerotolerans]QHI68912.1 hypothetical protein GT409_05435 [Tichowtungia aerotolerans]
MNKEKKEKLDIAGLLALKAFERPVEERVERNIQNTMQAVRAAHARPSLLLFPDKSMAWMFAQPRYGIAALFIIFLGLHLVRDPMPRDAVGPAIVQEPMVEMNVAAIADTNTPPAAIPAMPAIPTVRPNYSPLVRPVSFTE